MKKKKIIFSSSGGAPAIELLRCLIRGFGNNDISHIAAQIAATCRKAALRVWFTFEGELPELHGSTAESISTSSDTLQLKAENVSVNGYIISLEKSNE